MTFMYIVFYLIILGTLGYNFMSSLETIIVNDEFENENCEVETSTRDVYALSNGSWVIIGLAILWTAFAFWYIARQSIMAMFYL